MSSGAALADIPKAGLAREQRSAYQRWELDSFDAPGPAAAKPAGPSAEQLARIRQQAQREGFAAGQRAGADQVAAEAQRLRELADALGQALTDAVHSRDQQIAEELLALALAVSQQVLRQALAVKPGLILAAINDMLAQLPLAPRRARLFVHPEDAALVRQSLGERLGQSGWELVEHAHTGRGGCRLEAAECEVDATLAQRWQRVAGALRTGHAWID
jgi:flagellar assembly protein FliH